MSSRDRLSPTQKTHPGRGRKIRIVTQSPTSEREIDFVTTGEAARALGVRPRDVRRAIESGDLPGYRRRVGRGRWLIPLGAIINKSPDAAVTARGTDHTEVHREVTKEP